MEKLRTVRGVHDLLPDILHKQNLVINEGLKISEKYCYQQIETPIFEFAEVFTKPLGKTSDIVTKENYTFKDRSEDELMLRPEGTSGVVRAFLNAGLTQDIPKRYSYYGPMFRYERPQKGRLRQFKQFGIECIGIKNSMADVEVISLGHAFLEKLNILGKINLKINTLGDSESRLRYRKALVDYLNDYKSELSNESIKRLSENPLRILDSKNETDKKVLINAPNIIDYLNEASKERFENVCTGLRALKIKYQIDKNLVRGLDYYCHTAFEFVTSDLGSQGTVLAGGRYDGLAEMLGGVDTAGVGWAAGVDRLSLMINEEYVNKPDLVLMAVSENLEPLLMPIMKKLVDKGLKVEMLFTGNMSKKFKRANKIDASYAIILGEEELSKNIIKLKNLLIGSERYISLDEAIKVIKDL
jgi:histidyl-tRNA synthetase